METVGIKTSQRCEFVDITSRVQTRIREVKMQNGYCIIHCPHTTAGLTIQENADPDVVNDILYWLDNHIPKECPAFRHAEGNSDSHIKASLMGSSLILLIDNSRLVLGRWQGVYFCEFDGPRSRELYLSFMATSNNPSTANQ